jgi:hypothetical protein
MHTIKGGCHCGSISYSAEIPNAPSKYSPRECNCKYCSSHGASYVSDKKGKLTISIKDSHEISKYRQGSRIADFLVCRTCGVMTSVCYEENGQIYASINIRSANEYTRVVPLVKMLIFKRS